MYPTSETAVFLKLIVDPRIPLYASLDIYLDITFFLIQVGR